MKLSIITINYNNYDGLLNTIKSIVAQSYKDYEWIIIDGGSTDGSVDLIEQYTDYLAYWVSETDGGIYNAMNKGILRAKGEYINFMNSGDAYASCTILEEVFNCTHSSDILYGYMMRDDINGEFNNISMMKSHISWVDLYKDGLPHQSSFIKRSLFNELGLYDESLVAVADWKFFVNAIVYHNASYEFIPQKISIYASGGVSDSVGGDERECLKMKLFPRSMIDMIPMFESYNRIKSFKLTRWMYSLIDNISKRFERNGK